MSSFEITKVVVPELAAVSPNRPRGFLTEFINGNPVFNNGLKSLPKNPPE